MHATGTADDTTGDAGLDAFVARVRLGLWINIASNALFGVADLFLGSPHLLALFSLKLVSVAVSALALRLLKATDSRQRATRITLVVAAVVSAMAAASGVLTGDVMATAVLCVFLVLATATFLSWGVVPQLAVVAISGLAVLWNAYGILGSFAAVDVYSALGVVIALAASVCVAYEFERAHRDQSRALVALRDSEATLRSIFTDMQDVYFRNDFQGIIRMISPSVRHYGYEPEALIGRDARDLYNSPAEQQRVRAALLEHGSITDFETVLKRKDGTLFTASVSTRVLYDRDGRPVGFEGVLRDITPRKRHAEQIEALLDVANAISGTLDLHAILARVQPRIATLLPCDGVVTFYLDPTDDTYRLIGHYGLRPEGLAQLVPMRIPRSTVFGEQLLRGNTVVFNDPSEFGPNAKRILGRFPIAAMVASPLFVRGAMQGILIAFTRPGGARMLPERVQLFESIARQMAVGIEAVNLYLAQKENAEIFSTLVQAGQALIAAVGTPGLLERLCHVTAEALGCDFSHTLVRQDGAVYVPVANFGDSPEQWESLRLLRLHEVALGELLVDLERRGVAQMMVEARPDAPLHTVSAQYGVTQAYFIALRHGGEIFGIQVAGYRGRQQPFTPRQERIAKGIAQVASLALENARLIEKLERANRVKSDFVASMSHELRTPLAVILGYHDLLLNGTFGELNPEQADTVRRSERRSLELVDLVTAALDLSRLEAGRPPLQLQDTSTTELAEAIATDTREAWTKPAVDFVCQIAPGLPRLHTDPVKLNVVLKNLIGNAMKFTEQGSVVVNVRPSNNGVEFAVCDTGIGMAPEALAKIFEPFEQADGTINPRFGGAGLGLHIARRLVDMLSGTIAVDSEPGRGSTFRVWIPIETARPHR